MTDGIDISGSETLPQMGIIQPYSPLESERFDSPDSAVAVGAECRDRTNGRLIERSSGHYLPHSIHLPTKWNCQIGMHDMTDVQWRRSHDYACQAQACNGCVIRHIKTLLRVVNPYNTRV